MSSLWTDDDHSAHPWVAARPAAAPPAPPPAEQPAAPHPWRGAALVTACAVAALAGAVFEVLR